MVKWERVSTHPDGWATKIYKGLVVSRRQFIAGTGASFFMPLNASAVDLDEILAGRTKLSFYWNKEERRFNVAETPEFSLFSAAEKKKLFDKEKEGLKAEWIWEVDPILT